MEEPTRLLEHGGPVPGMSSMDEGDNCVRPHRIVGPIFRENLHWRDAVSTTTIVQCHADGYPEPHAPQFPVH